MFTGVNVLPLSPSDFGARAKESYSRGGTLLGDKMFCRWTGYASLATALMATELDIVTPSQMKTQPDVPAMIVPARAIITSLSIRATENLTLGNATGRIKASFALADAIGPAATDGYNVYSPAAVGGVLTRPDPKGDVWWTKNFTLFGSAGLQIASDIRMKIYATDSTGQAATTMSALKPAKILFCIGFYVPGPNPTELGIGKSFYTPPS